MAIDGNELFEKLRNNVDIDTDDVDLNSMLTVLVDSHSNKDIAKMLRMFLELIGNGVPSVTLINVGSKHLQFDHEGSIAVLMMFLMVSDITDGLPLESLFVLQQLFKHKTGLCGCVKHNINMQPGSNEIN